MLSNAPTLYCDVDGVINIATMQLRKFENKIIFRKLPTKAGEKFWAVPLNITWRKQVSTALSLMNVNFFWLTTWNHQAVNILEPLTGIKSAGVLDYKMPLRETMSQHSKYLLLKKHQKINPTPFIWIDDVATKHYLKDDFPTTQPHLVIRTQTKQGITDEHITQINEFISKNTI